MCMSWQVAEVERKSVSMLEARQTLSHFSTTNVSLFRNDSKQPSVLMLVQQENERNSAVNTKYRLDNKDPNMMRE